MDRRVGFVSTGIINVAPGLRNSTFTCYNQQHRHGRPRLVDTGKRNARLDKTIGNGNVVTATATPIEVSEDTFESEVLKSDVPVVVDFYAPWCGPCKLMSPLMEWAAAEFDGKVKLVKIDTELNESFVKTYEIYGLPTFAVFVNGEAKGVQEGAMTKVVFKQYIEEHAF